MTQHIFITVVIAFAAFSMAWFFFRFFKKPRSLWLGVSFLTAVTGLLGLVTLLLVRFWGSRWAEYALIAGVALVLLVLMTFPFALIASLLSSGTRLIRREGFSLSHALSLGLGVFYMLYLLFWPILGGKIESGLLDFLYDFLTYCFVVTAAIFAVYTVTNLLSLIPRRRKYQYIIVLGSGLRRDGTLTPLLAGRVDKGIENYQTNPGSLLIMSGGQGADEIVAEAEAMRRYAVDRGVPTTDIITEDQSTNTYENLLFSKRLIEQHTRGEGRILLVTTRYHVLRALLLSRELDIPCDGQGSKTKLYFSINAFVREWIAYLVLYKRSYIALLLLGLALAVIVRVLDAA